MAETVITGLGLLIPGGRCPGFLRKSGALSYAEDVDLKPRFDEKLFRRIRGCDRASELAVKGALLALEAAGCRDPAFRSDRAGVVMGNGTATDAVNLEFLSRLLDRGPSRARPGIFPYTTSCMPAGMTAIMFGLEGPTATFSYGKTASLQALEYASALIERNKADFMLAGGICALNDRLENILRDLNFRPVELSAFAVLEERSKALNRGAKIICSVGERVSFFGGGDFSEMGDFDVTVARNGASAAILSDDTEVFDISALFGDVFEAAGLLGVCMSAALMEEKTSGKTVVVSRNDSGQTDMAVLIKGAQDPSS